MGVPKCWTIIDRIVDKTKNRYTDEDRRQRAVNE
jgi:hypothetical protein